MLPKTSLARARVPQLSTKPCTKSSHRPSPLPDCEPQAYPLLGNYRNQSLLREHTHTHTHTHIFWHAKDSAGETISAVRLSDSTAAFDASTHGSHSVRTSILCVYNIFISTYCCFAVALYVPRAASCATHGKVLEKIVHECSCAGTHGCLAVRMDLFLR